MEWETGEIADMLIEIENRTFASMEDIETVLKVMEHFLSGFSGSRASAVRHLERMKDAMFIEIGEKDWADWLKADYRRAKYIDRALSEFEIRSSKELMDLSYFLFVRDIYEIVLSRLRAKLSRRKAAKKGRTK